MKFSFREPTEAGVVAFDGELSNQDLNYLLQYAIMDLIHKGALVNHLKVIEVPDEDEDPSVRH